MAAPTPCAYCGSPADEIGRINHTRDCTEITYRCTNPRCLGITTGLLTLKRAGLPASGRYLHPDPPHPAGETTAGRQIHYFAEQQR